MISDKDVGYCVYNSSADTVRLYVPPIPVSMSGASKHHFNKTHDGSWLVKMTGHVKDGATLSPVYCGYDGAASTRSVSLYSAPPQLGNTAMGVCDDKKNFFGHAIVHGATAGNGALFNLAFVNNSGAAETIEYGFENLDKLPSGMSALLINPETGNSEEISGTAGLKVAATHTAYRNLAVGSNEYLAKVKIACQVWKLDLLGAYPNPFSRAVRIRYSLPGTGISRVTMSIVNVFGRTVFQKTQSAVDVTGERELLWNGTDSHKKQVASGIYFVKMTALDANSNQTAVFQKKITYLP